MKRQQLLFLLASSLFIAGCAGSGGTGSTSPSSESPVLGEGETSADQAGVKTAYDGSTGAGLLMERYKSGSIEGLNN